MATAAYTVLSPAHLLRQVQELEDMELPSIPSFQHDNDYDSASVGESSADYSSRSSNFIHYQDEMITPHPLRKTYLPPSVDSQTFSANSSSSSASSAPYPPITGVEQTPSPYIPTAALTSTPLTLQQSKSRSQSISDPTGSTYQWDQSDRRTTSGSTVLESSGKEKWHTPGQLSESFSEDEIAPQSSLPGVSFVQTDGVTADASITSGRMDPPTETPLTRRLSSNNVVLNRRGKRATSNVFQIPMQPVPEIISSAPADAIDQDAQSSPASQHLKIVDDYRIPSLSRSEMSTSDSSAAGSTPEGPSRNPHIVTPRSEGAGTARRLEYHEMDNPSHTSLSDSHGLASDVENVDTHDILAAPSLGSLLQDSPAKTVVSDQNYTPGMGRVHPRNHTPSDLGPTPRPTGILQDVTSSFQDPSTPVAPFTPSPSNLSTKTSDFGTPRAPLNDSERRKNHVLAVLNSTGLPTRTWRTVARGTPHPLRRVSMAPMTQSISEDEPSFSVHAQVTTTSANDSMSRLPNASNDQIGNESFASIASSADLTSDRRATSHRAHFSRANTSFPSILLPTHSSSPGQSSLRGLSDQRADGIKIHKHLNAMNKQLLDANADLAREAEAWQEEVERLHERLRAAGIAVEIVEVAAQRTSGDTARRSVLSPKHSHGGDVSNPIEPIILEGLSQEQQKTVLKDLAQRLEAFRTGMNERDQVIVELQEALDAAREDQGQPEVVDLQSRINELVEQVEAAEKYQITLQSDFASKTEQHAKQFGEICTAFEDQVKYLERDLDQAKDEIRHLRDDRSRLELISDGNGQQKHDGEQERVVLQREELERIKLESRAREEEISRLEREIRLGSDDRQDLLSRAETAEFELHTLTARLEAAEAAAADFDDIRAKLDELNDVQINGHDDGELRGLERENENLRSDIVRRDDELRDLSDRLQQLEADMEDSEREEQQAQQQLVAEVGRLNAIIKDSDDRLIAREAELETLHAKTKGSSDEGESAKVLEGYLEEAYREIGRLKQKLASAPHLQSTLSICEARVESLEREKAALLGRLSSARDSSPSGVQTAASPFKASPFVHKAIASLRMPKTPGSLQDLSWLQTTIGDANEPILRAQLEYFQHQLEDANGQLDSNFSRLEAAGMNGVLLAEQLAAAQNRIAELEDESQALAQRNKASLALVSAQRDEAGRDGDARLKKALQTVQRQMEAVQADLRTERARLQKENERLSALVSDLRRDHLVDLEAVGTESDRRVADVEKQLRRMKSEINMVIKEKESLKRELKESQDKFDDLRAQLSTQRSIAHNSSGQQRPVTSDREKEGSQQKVVKLERALQTAEAEARLLQRTLDKRQAALYDAENTIDTLKAERAAVAGELISFERDLRDQRKDSQQFGIQLQLLRSQQQSSSARHAAELATVEGDYRSAQERLMATEKQLEDIRRAKNDLSRWKETHRCDSGLSSALEQQRSRFKAQSQDLATQIRYLKAKCTRESTFRNALALQKKYLLLLVGGMSLNEQATLKQIASMGYPTPAPPRKTPTLKVVGIAVLGLIRARNAAALWRNERQVKLSAIAARDKRRRTSS